MNLIAKNFKSPDNKINMTRNRGLTVSRRKEILQMLSEKGEVMVNELTKKFGVSEVTIRNDLTKLERRNMLIRAAGGAIKVEGNVVVDRSIDELNPTNFAAQSRIGQKAAWLVNESDTIVIDSGSIAAVMVKSLPEFQELTVITHDVNIANQLVKKPNVSVIMPGGYLRKNSLSLVGPQAEKSLKNFNVDKAFIAVDGFDSRKGIFTPNVDEARLNEVMIEISKEVILLVDSTKFNHRSFAFICSLSEIDKVITDAGIKPDDQERLKDANIEVIIA